MWRRLIHWTVAAVLWLLLLEGFSWIIHRVVFHESFSYRGMARLRHQRIAAVAAQQHAKQRDPSSLVPHPYLGFVYNPAYRDETGEHPLPVSEWGFLDDKSPLRPARSDEVVIGIFGGSVAFWLSVRGDDAMIEELSKVPQYRGKHFVIVRTGLGGFKQPQQLMTLNYLLALGGHFDIIVNLDGFNEVALPPAAQIPRDIFPFYPRSWPDLLGQAGDPQLLRMTGRVLNMQQDIAERARQFSGPITSRSVFANTLWRLLDRRMNTRLAQARYEMETWKPPEPAERRMYSGVGPVRRYKDSAAMYADLVAVWQRSSLQMHRICKENRIRYFHFIQPNQYLTGSKPMSDAERRVAIQPGRSFEKDVPVAYPRLAAAGRDLAAQGVLFEDLSRIFAGISEPLYIDTCCHFNEKGNEILGRRMGRRMASVLARPVR